MRTFLTSAAAALLFIAGCQVFAGAEQAPEQALADASSGAGASQDPRATARERALQRTRGRAQAEAGAIGVIVDKSDRKVRVYRNGQLLREHDVAVGAPQWETPTGTWAFERVDINPEWIPPDSPWAAGEPRRPAGHPENPMGQARLVFNLPYTIHGTDDLDSLGTAASHGSIRVANQHVIPLAELLLKAGGAWQGRQWFESMVLNRNTEFEIRLPQPIPIEVRE